MSEAALQLRGACKTFGHVRALQDVNLELHQNEVLALVGDNGAGKSTLVKILSGVEQPDTGEVIVGGEVVRLASPAAAQSLGIATVYQDLALVDPRSVAANIYLGREPRRLGMFVDYPRMYRDAATVLTRLRVDIPTVRAQVRKLSGGQRQAVAIARALARESNIYLFDEPTAALGVEQQANVNQLIEDLKNDGSSIVLISHNLEHVFEVADRIVVMRNGRCVASIAKADTTRHEVVGLITGAIAQAVA
ncbi:MAG: ribose transport system ATP-binding protein [Pseudonocardiales bacterium]|jgi:ABC-type sugar transport system ATPase subunit|nr:ribose transport system ATP-binding protein [Pseudonocardiales bacterium]